MIVRFAVAKAFLLAAVGLGLCVGCGKPEPEQPAAAEKDAVHDHVHGDGTHSHGDGSDPHDVPITAEQKEQLRTETAQFADAIERIKQFRDAVEEETKDGIPENPYEAHQALDRVDLVLQWLPEIARGSNVPEEQWKTVDAAAAEIRGAFDQVHKNIDDGADPGFPSLKDAVEQAIGRLEAAAETQPTGE